MESKHPIALISIVIPCYKTEQTLDETLSSVFNQVYTNWEAIIVNDGSPDNLEEIALAWVEKDNRFKYFKKENGGLGSARNFGISKAVGKYILPLDSDNKVRPGFVLNSIKIMEANLNIGVVYGDAMYFGEKSERWKVGQFDKFRLLYSNYIDACALIRKSVFEITEGYDIHMPYQGHEDWEFWLQVLETDFQFYYLNEITFDYRYTSDSMIRSLDKPSKRENSNYVRIKHSELYLNAYVSLYKSYSKLKKGDRLSFFKRFLNKIGLNNSWSI